MKNEKKTPRFRAWLFRMLKQFVMSLLLLLFLEVLVIGSGFQREIGRWLQVKDLPAMTNPDWIVVLGGGGIPSESGLIRCYYGSTTWKKYPEATCIVSLPADDDPEVSSVGLMKKELLMRGVPEEKILMETKAVNTRQQAQFLMEQFGETFQTGRVMLVSSPFHLRRAVTSFEQAGCEQVGVLSAASIGAEADFGAGTFFRYTLWGILEDQAVILRELVALTWYRISS